MLAWRVHEYGPYRDKLRLEQVDEPTAPDTGVCIEVKAAGINFFDILSVAGQYQVRAPLPFTPGTEAAGVVVEAGERSRYAPGDRLIVSNLWGAFAQRMVAPDVSCFPIPEGMSDAKAASMLIAYQTAYFALVHRAAIRRQEVLVVHGGAGGVGTAAIQLGKALGAEVIATAGSADKMQVCRDCGADHVIDYSRDDFVAAVKRLTGGRGADVIYDPVGGDVFDRSTKCVAWGGRIVVIGFAAGRIPEIKANRILLKNMSVVGLNWGGYLSQDPELIHSTHARLEELYRDGRFDPIVSDELPLDGLVDAMDRIASRRSYGKLVLRPDLTAGA
jgi:NADPH2:quinone reductase